MRIRRAIICSSTVWVAGLLLMGHPAAFAQTAPAAGAPRALSAVEQQIVAAVDAQATDAVALLERTVNIPSAILNLAGVRRVGDIFAAELQHLGFAIRWVSMPQTAAGLASVVAQPAILQGDLRYVSEEQREKAKARMQVIVDQHLPGASSSISFREEMPPMSPRPENQLLLNSYDQVSRDLGLGAVAARDPEDGGAADISFVAFVPGLDGLGVIGKHSHAATEEIDLNSLSAQAKRAALLIYRLTSATR
jgi:acetylornithine deacetylase/succinyl-diaminopimelate desuccinylase-like protein